MWVSRLHLTVRCAEWVDRTRHALLKCKVNEKDEEPSLPTSEKPGITSGKPGRLVLSPCPSVNPEVHSPFASSLSTPRHLVYFRWLFSIFLGIIVKDYFYLKEMGIPPWFVFPKGYLLFASVHFLLCLLFITLLFSSLPRNFLGHCF